MHKSSFRLLFLAFATLLASGCAHQRLVEAGEDLNRQGKYELAVEKYKKALELRPNDRKTQQNLEFAQAELDIWLEQLYSQADLARQNGLNGRAMILYAKVAQLQRGSNALNHYKQLHREIKDQAYYKLALQLPDNFTPNTARQLKHIQLVDAANSAQNNEFAVKLDFTAPKFSRKTSKKKVTQQYVSGTETIANPDYHHLQQDIAIDRDNIAEYSEKASEQYHIISDLKDHLIDYRKDRELAQLRMQNEPVGSANYYRWRNEITRLNGVIADVENDLAVHQRKLSSLEVELADHRQLLDKHLNELSYLPPTVEQDVYSDYSFNVKQVTKLANGNLTLRFKNGPTKHKAVTTQAADETHEAHPVIELDHNPLKLPSDSTMTVKYQQEVSRQAEKLLTKHAGDYRQQLKRKAQNTNGFDQQFEAFVQYGLSGDDGVDDSTGRQMRRQLEQEFGITGEFPINKLLNLYR